mgnify:CR=1 FL=1
MGSSIGFFWAVINPLVELMTYTFVFHVLMGVKFSERGGTVHYSLFLFCGMVGWFALAEGCQRATWSIRENAQLIKKVNFPAAVLPASVVFSAIVNQYIRFGVLALAIIFLGTGAGTGLSPLVITLPIFVAIQAIFVLGLSFFLATASFLSSVCAGAEIVGIVGGRAATGFDGVITGAGLRAGRDAGA